MALNGNDNRLATEGRPETERIDEVGILGRQNSRGLSGSERRHVESRAEIAADAVQDRDAQFVIVVELIIGFAQSDQDWRIDAVLRLRPIYPDQHDRTASF